MEVYEDKGLFIPLPETSTDRDDNKKGKTYSNRNYGADKKRQRKQTERVMLENRIMQLETNLLEDHSMELNDIS